MHILTTLVSSVVFRLKKLEIKKKKKELKSVYEPKKPQTLCHEIEPNPSKDRAMHEGDNFSFSDEFIEIYFFLDSFIHNLYF
jgi:hypothetical protein